MPLRKLIDAANSRPLRRLEALIAPINAWEPELQLLSDTEIAEAVARLRERAGNGEPLSSLLVESFALTREAGVRTLGLRLYNVQLLGGAVMAMGKVAEMKTGEGKTLTATAPAALHALSGNGAHIVTVNEYLAHRDALWMLPIYKMLGLSVGLSLRAYDAATKRRAYASDITYVTNSEAGFDYLRDNLAKTPGERVGGRPPNFALVDEIDNILIDEARVPLIISGETDIDADLYYRFAELARTLEIGERPPPTFGVAALTGKGKSVEYDFDYEIDEKQKTVSITERGVTKAEAFLGIPHLYRAENGHLVSHLNAALKAETLYLRDREYALVDGGVEIIDVHTGRILGGRRWGEGLHQAVEAKEGVPITTEQHPIASITYQNFFRRYPTLCGMTGTALTEATELRSIYSLDTLPVPTHRSVARIDQGDLMFSDMSAKWRAVVREVKNRSSNGQPVLVGTASVEASEELSRRFEEAGIKHTLLNARPERVAVESQTISQAGRVGAVTIATNMAGRGVDIKLGGDAETLAQMQLAAAGTTANSEDYAEQLKTLTADLAEDVAREREIVVAAGGLYVLGTERHESRRIDNQLRGRSGRQGDPGESCFMVSAEDQLLRVFGGGRLLSLLTSLTSTDDEGFERPVQSKRISKQIENAQKHVEELHYLDRKHTLEYDDVANSQREVIYNYRNSILDAKELDPPLSTRPLGVAEHLVDEYADDSDFAEDWDWEGLERRVHDVYSFEFTVSPLNAHDRDAVKSELKAAVTAFLATRAANYPPQILPQLERYIALTVIDSHWQQMLADLDYLRSGIGLRGIGQIDPLVAYRNEAYQLFGQTMDDIWLEFSFRLAHMNVEIKPAETPETAPEAGPQANGGETSANQEDETSVPSESIPEPAARS